MSLQPASPSPTRNPNGSTTAFKWNPMSECGYGDPTFYHQFYDDFDNQLGAAGLYTASGGGTLAHTPGDGGLALFTTLATASSFESAQLPAGSFTLPGTGATPPASSQSVKKLFWVCRLQLAAPTTDSFIAGLCVITATPFSAGARNVTDGLFFYKAAGGTALQLINIGSAGSSPSGSAFTNIFTIPTNTYTLTANVNIDLGFSIDSHQNLFGHVGSQLYGYLPQSGFGPVNAAGYSPLPVLAPVFANYNYLAQFQNLVGPTSQNPILYTLANLSPTLAVSNGTTAAVTTMTVDFHGALKER